MIKLKGSATETKETPDGAHSGKSTEVDTPFETDPMDVPKVGVEFGAGFTEPTKPYGNVKFFVGLKIECGAGEQDDVFEFAKDWVDERLGQAMAEVKENYPD